MQFIAGLLIGLMTTTAYAYGVHFVHSGSPNADEYTAYVIESYPECSEEFPSCEHRVGIGLNREAVIDGFPNNRTIELQVTASNELGESVRSNGLVLEPVSPFGNCFTARFDVDQSGRVSATDALIVLKASAGTLPGQQ